MDERQHGGASGPPDEDLEISVSSLRPERSASSQRPRRFGGRFWYRLVGTVALGALLATGILAWFHPSLPHPQLLPDPLTINVAAGGLPCAVEGAAWSPDGTRIVLVGEFACPVGQVSGPEDGVLAIVDAATGHGIARVALGPAVVAQVVPLAVRKNPPLLRGVTITYSQPLWSPDGRTIAVTFAAYQAIELNNQSGGNPFYGYGLVVVTVATGAVRVLVGPAVAIVPPGTIGEPAVQRWDLARGTQDAVPVPPALTYRWASDGSLIPSDLVPATPATPPPTARGGPVGNPTGASSFSMWQSGTIQYSAARCQPFQGTGSFGPGPVSYSPADYYQLSLYTPAWSPDGRYLLLALSAQGRLPLPPPPPASTPTPPSIPQSPGRPLCFNGGPAAQAPRMPMRDAGLQAALLLVALNTQPAIQVIWRPDGQRLAVEPEEISNGAPALTIFDCRTGRVRAQLAAHDIVPSETQGQPFSMMAWSPDGRHLLVVPEGPSPFVFVLGPRTLGG